MQLPQLDDYRQLFLNDIPLLDVRAPVEFEQGAFPQASNVPLMDNDERHQVGIRYKEQGQDEALRLGHDLVKGDIKTTRISEWVRFAEQHPQGALYCFRGGQRSKICQQWIYEASGVIYPRVQGGYKAMRRFLIEELNTSVAQLQAVIVGGHTGSGKTRFLLQLQQHIDLEGIFNHRGSAFGKYARAQPAQIDIENSLAIRLLQFRNQQVTRLLLEDEAPNIGSRRIPTPIYQTMQQSPVVILEVPVETRVQNIFNEYIHVGLEEHRQLHGQEQGFESWALNLQQALQKIERRLGGQRYREIKAIMDDALHLHRAKQQIDHHKQWISRLLSDYYDPMYEYQLDKKMDRVVQRGDNATLLAYLHQQHALS